MPHCPKTRKLFKVSLLYTVSMPAKYNCLSESDLHGSYEFLPPWGGETHWTTLLLWLGEENRLVIWCIYTASGHAALRFWQVHCLKFNIWKEAECFTCFAGVNRNGALVTSHCETYATRPEKHSQYLSHRKQGSNQYRFPKQIGAQIHHLSITEGRTFPEVKISSVAGHENIGFGSHTF